MRGIWNDKLARFDVKDDDYRCPNCGSQHHIHCTRQSDIDAIERKVQEGKSVAEAAIEYAAEQAVNQNR